MSPIKHIWFDFSETIASLNPETHDKLWYETYAEVTDQPVTDELKEECARKYTENKNSRAAVFRSLGKSSNFWSERINTTNPAQYYKLIDPKIPNILRELKDILPISLFSNVELQNVLPVFGIDVTWFTHILSSGMVQNPKPALDGYYKLIELSNLPSENILYIGDNVWKDILPAKQVGIQTGLMWNHSDEADYSFTSFEEVLQLVKS